MSSEININKYWSMKINALEDGRKVDAFDKVDHYILPEKLSSLEFNNHFIILKAFLLIANKVKSIEIIVLPSVP